MSPPFLPPQRRGRGENVLPILKGEGREGGHAVLAILAEVGVGVGDTKRVHPFKVGQEKFD